MSGTHSPHSALSTPTPASLSITHRNNTNSNMILPPTPPPTACFSGNRDSGGEQHITHGAGKYSTSSTSPSFASVVSASAGSSSALSSSLHPTLATSPLQSSSLQQQIQKQKSHQYQQHEHGHTSPAPSLPATSLLSSSNTDNNRNASLPISSSAIPSNMYLHSATDPSSGCRPGTRSRSTSLSCSSRYHSPLASPAISANHSNDSGNSAHGYSDKGSGGADDDAEHEDSESSDVEIYLNTLGLHDSASRMHVLVSGGA
ncbi:hypothetical protein B0H34DRAFT_798437 [Crassisporium funariophilum]|nr:hypothetical protein B0H34DRAFT_798437 [Crassisporium funariophilum]